MLDNFIKMLEDEVRNKSIYVWGGNGQTAFSIIESWIKQKETSTKDATRAINLLKKNAPNLLNIKMFDCSGLMYYCLKKLNLQTTDISANGLKGKCQLITKDKLCKGCFVFKCDSSGKATHVGFVVDDSLNVIECQGRDLGVVKRPLSANNWNTFGVSSYFTIPKKSNTTPIFNRVLKLGICGDDVKLLKEKLYELKYLKVKPTHSTFGSDTEEAVKQYQKNNGLVIDGKAGKDTLTKLGFTWR